MTKLRFGSKKDKLRLSEKDVDKQISSYMAARGWRRIRHNVGMMFGEKGMCDLQFVYYFAEPYGAALVLWVETKRPGASLACHCRPGHSQPCHTCRQAAWRAKERRAGARCWVVSDFKEFAAVYEEKFAWLLGRDRQGRLF